MKLPWDWRGNVAFYGAKAAVLVAGGLFLSACAQIPAGFERTPIPSVAAQEVAAAMTLPASSPVATETLPAGALVAEAPATETPTTETPTTETPTADAPPIPFALSSPTSRAVVLLPTATPRPTAEATLQTVPVARILNRINVRSGPGTMYPVVGGLVPDARVEIVGRNDAADWWQVVFAQDATGWVSAPLVEVEGDPAVVTVPANIPTPPPTALPAPTAPSAPTPSETATDAIASATAAPTPSTAGMVFRVVDKRLWDVYENGGSLFGDSVTCGEKRQLVVTVLDEAGNRLNGVAVQVLYGAQEVYYTGSQGRGDGNAEFVLGGGQDVKVIRDTDGSDATSEVATGLSTNPAAIPFEQLINAQYCTDAQSCQRFVDAPGCFGHFSWTVTFQRERVP